MIKNRNNIEINNNILVKNLDYNIYFNQKIHKLNNQNDVFFCFIKEKIGIKELKNILKDLDNINYIKLFLITKYKFNSYINNKLNEIENKLEVFSFNFFHFDLISHKLIPKHVLLNEKKENMLKKKFGKNKLPIIKTNDPVSCYFNAKPGQIFKIYRTDEIYYRIVL